VRSIAERAALAPLFLLYVLLIAGCAADGTSSGSRPAAPASNYNLAGYSAAFKEGYADACASPRRRSAQRYKSDTDYQMGWNDGSSMCRGR
jgi:hypothetical protein